VVQVADEGGGDMSRWFRHYAGMMRDEKLVRAALMSKQPVERVVWVWGAILESAAEINDGGRFSVDYAEMAYFLRSEYSELEAIGGALAAIGRIENGCVTKWKERQFESDSSTKRVQKHRAEKHETLRNVSETECNAPETETETENIDRKKDKPSGRSRSATRPVADSDFDEFRKVYPKRLGIDPRAPALKKFQEAIRGGAEPAAIIAGAVRYAEHMRKAERIGTQYVMQSKTWLNQRVWEDYAATAPPQGNQLAAERDIIRRQIEEATGGQVKNSDSGREWPDNVEELRKARGIAC
jgi:hypothetical protein